MTEKANKTRVRLVVLSLWIVLAAFYFSLAYDYIVASNRDKEFNEYLSYIVEVCGDDRRPTDPPRGDDEERQRGLREHCAPDRDRQQPASGIHSEVEQ